MKLPYYKSLDGLRGIAAMMVVLFHFYSYPNGYYSEEGFFKKATEIGQHGVSLFFVLSGFVITRILIHTKGESQYFTIFFAKRILRIAPLYYLFLAVWFYALPFILHYPIEPAERQLPYYLYLQNIFSTLKIPMSGPPHFWSLAVEEHFYLVWPFVVYYTSVRNLSKVIVISIILIFVVKYFMIQNNYPIHDFTLTRVDQILMGAFLALLELKGFYKPESVRYFIKSALTIIPIACAIYIFRDQYPFLKELFKYFLLGISFASIIGIVISLKPESFVNTFLTSAPLQYLGKISYGIYVWHVIPLIFLQFFLLTKIMLLDIIVVITFAILMAHISYFYFESIFIRLKDHILPRPGFKMMPGRFLMGWSAMFRGTRKS